MKTILITGGAGFIGSNLIARLLQKRLYKIICFDNFDPFYSPVQKKLNIQSFLSDSNFKLVEGDICDPLDLAKIASRIDAIVHLAAKAGIGPSLENAQKYLEVNVGGTQNLLEFAKISDIKQFIFASSSSVYGINNNSSWQEHDNTIPISPYAASKLSAEIFGQVYSHLYGIRFLALRLFTVYGPGQRPDLAIHKFVKAITENKTLTIYGDGSSSRDYTYVSDIVDGIISAIEYEDSLFQIINLGNNKTISLNALLKTIENVVEKQARTNFESNQPGDVLYTCGNITKAQELLNYHPTIDLYTGLSHFYKWYKHRNELKKNI